MYVGTSIYKVGMSSVPDLSRLRSYGKGSRYIGMAEVGSNYLAVEKTLIHKFNQSFRLARGREYFDVDDEAKARSIFLKTVTDATANADPLAGTGASNAGASNAFGNSKDLSTMRIAGNAKPTSGKLDHGGMDWSAFRFNPDAALAGDKKKETPRTANPRAATGVFARFAFNGHHR